MSEYYEIYGRNWDDDNDWRPLSDAEVVTHVVANLRREVLEALGAEWWCSAPRWQAETLDEQKPLRTEGFARCTPDDPHDTEGCHWSVPQPTDTPEGDTDE